MKATSESSVWLTRLPSGPGQILSGQLAEPVQQVLQYLNDHLGGVGETAVGGGVSGRGDDLRRG